MGPVHVVRYASPDVIPVRNDGKEIACCIGGAGIALGAAFTAALLLLADGQTEAGALLLGEGPITALGAGLLAARLARTAVRRTPNGLPDLCELVMTGFVARSRDEIPGWPTMVVEPEPVQDLYAPRGKLVLEFRPIAERVMAPQGYECTVLATLMDTRGDVLWQQISSYRTRRTTKTPGDSLGQSEVSPLDLREMVEAAAEAIVSHFVASLRGER
jgi:hypothetical protein